MTWKDKGYLVVRNFMKSPSILYNYTLDNKKKGDLTDAQVPNTASFYNDKIMKKHQDQFLTLVEKHTELKLFKTYNYYRVYKKGDILKKHSDRPACEISVTLNLGFKGKAWPLFMEDYEKLVNEVLLEPGDAVIYRGCDLEHWRDENKYADDYSQIFFHFVNQDGPNAWAKDDIER